MEISSVLVERALGGVNELALPVAGASCLYLALRAASPLMAEAGTGSRRRTRRRLLRRGVSLLGLSLVASPTAAAVRRRPPAPAAVEVRTEPGRFPPPRLPGSAGPFEDPPWSDGDRGRPSQTRHPAVHGGTVDRATEPLFDRLPDRAAKAVRVDRLAHPGGRDAAPSTTATIPPGERWHAVLPGETLWSIAARRLGTDDIRRIARYWPRIHRLNRAEIGPNPDLIRPGQVLELPSEEA